MLYCHCQFSLLYWSPYGRLPNVNGLKQVDFRHCCWSVQFFSNHPPPFSEKQFSVCLVAEKNPNFLLQFGFPPIPAKKKFLSPKKELELRSARAPNKFFYEDANSSFIWLRFTLFRFLSLFDLVCWSRIKLSVIIFPKRSLRGFFALLGYMNTSKDVADKWAKEITS